MQNTVLSKTAIVPLCQTITQFYVKVTNTQHTVGLYSVYNGTVPTLASTCAAKQTLHFIGITCLHLIIYLQKNITYIYCP